MKTGKSIFWTGILILCLLLVALAPGCSSQAGMETPAEPDVPGEEMEQESEPQAEPQPRDTSADVLVITDALFLYQVEDIYNNLDAYLGQAVRIEGYVEILELGDERWTGIYRTVIDCCEDHPMMSGLDVVYDGQMPEQDAWVLAQGIVTRGINELGDAYPVLELEWLEILPERGLDTIRL